MNRDLSDYRKSYEQQALSENTMPTHPVEFFEQWFKEVQSEGSIEEVNAMTLTTVGLDGFSKGRVVLLKKYDECGFYFYTNYLSEKGKSIAQNNKVSLSFFWPSLERQIIIKGTASKTSEDDSNNYFNNRPKGSQLGALVSNQSEVIETRKVIENKLALLENQYFDKEIKKPANWGGYLVSPISIEFWQGRPNRLHDRIRYRLSHLDWIIERLSP